MTSISRYAKSAINTDRNIDGLIQPDTTPQQFDARCRADGIELHKGESFNGSTPLMNALFINMSLVEHIIQTGGKHLLDMGDENGISPMYFCLSRVYNLPAVIKLTQLGADVNLLIRINPSWSCTVLWKLVVDMETTPLKARHITLKALLRQGAIAIPELSEKGKKIIAHAETEMRQSLISVLIEGNLSWTMPREIAHCIFSYVPKNEMPLSDKELEQVGPLWNEQTLLSDHDSNRGCTSLKDNDFKMDCAS